MHPVLRELQNQIALDLEGLDELQTQLRPVSAPEKWSVQQIMEHLHLTYASTCEVVEGRIAKGTPTKATPSLQQRIWQWAVFCCGYFPRGRKAPTMVAPQPGTVPVSGYVLKDRTVVLLARLDSAVAQAEELFGDKRAITHGILGPLNASQWRRFQMMHGQHHLRQIRVIRSEHGL